MKTYIKTTILLLVAFLLPVTATAYDFMVNGLCFSISGNTVGVTYQYNSNTAYSSLSGDLIIPSSVTYNGTTYSVTFIGYRAFYNCTGLTSVTIPNSVTSIGGGAFSGCSGLTSVTIGNSVTFIAQMAFYNCTSLTSVTIPNSVTTIGQMAFSGTAWYNNQPDGVVYAGLVAYKYKGTMPVGTSIILRDGTTSIADCAFGYCSGMTSVTIPNSVTYFGERAFENCYELRKVTIPESVIFLGSWTFQNSGLEEINIPSKADYYQPLAGCHIRKLEYNKHIDYDFDYSDYLKYEDNYDFSASGRFAGEALGHNSYSLDTLIIGDNVTVIPPKIANNSNLGELIIPKNVQIICDDAFTNESGVGGCIRKLVWNAKNCHFEGGLHTSLRTAYHGDGYGDTINVVFGDEVEVIPKNLCRGTRIKSLVFPESLKSIEDSAFRYCHVSQSSLTISKNVNHIGDYAFSFASDNGTEIDTLFYNAINCNVREINYDIPWHPCLGSDAKNVIIGDEVESIPYGFCDDNYELKKLVIPNSVKTVRGFNNVSIEELTVGESVEDFWAFEQYSYPKLKTLTWNAINCNTAGSYNSFKKDSLEVVTISDKVRVIPSYLLYNANKVKSFVIPDSVEEIKDHAFSGSGITSIVIPNSVISIGDYAFSGCDGLTSVNFGNSVTSITGGAFSGCSGLTSVTIPNSVTSIGGEAFSGCTALTSVTFGNSVTFIAQMAFYNCTSLTSVTIPNSVTSIGQEAFKYCSGLTSVTIPNSVTSIGKWAFYNCSGLSEIRSRIVDASNVTMGWDVFLLVNKNSCVLKVPIGASNSYKNADQWKSFRNIKEVLLKSSTVGDLNFDNSVDGTDINIMVGQLIKNSPYEDADGACDLNGDGKVNGIDLHRMISIILGQ